LVDIIGAVTIDLVVCMAFQFIWVCFK
jgi:hypothetical protein